MRLPINPSLSLSLAACDRRWAISACFLIIPPVALYVYESPDLFEKSLVA